MSPEAHDLKARMAAVKMVAEIRSDDDTFKPQVTKLIQHWMEVAAAGMTLISGNQKLKGVDDYAGFWKGDGQALVKTILNTRKRFTDTVEKIEAIVAGIDVGTSEDPFAQGFHHLLGLKAPPAMITELQSEKFDDAVSFRAAELTNKLDNFKTMHGFDTKGFANQQENSWKADIREDAPLSQLQEAAQVTLMKLPGKAMKDAVDFFMEAGLETTNEV